MSFESYIYSMKRLNHGSDRYGPCEVCGAKVDTAYLQVESQEYEYLPPGSYEVIKGITRYDCHDYIGHKQCLIGVQYPNRFERKQKKL